MPPFTVETLAPEQFRAVYPLIRETIPGLDLAAWLRFARQLRAARKSGQAGIVAATRAGRSYPCGLFCYRVDHDLERGRVLIAEHFVAIDLLDPAAVLGALVAELEALGHRLNCNAVRSVVHDAATEVTGGLSKAGHTPDGTLLLKPLLAAVRSGSSGPDTAGLVGAIG
jgi:hypothetical protein